MEDQLYNKSRCFSYLDTTKYSFAKKRTISILVEANNFMRNPHSGWRSTGFTGGTGDRSRSQVPRELGRTAVDKPSFNTINTHAFFIVPEYDRAGPGHEIPHPSITIQQSACRVLDVTALMWIDSDRLTVAEMQEAITGAWFQWHGWDEIRV